MRYIIENNYLSIEIDSFGAEVKSVKSRITGREYMWNGDKKYWGRTSPVLFPFVGGLNNKEYFVDGKTYHMTQHGFARDMEHTVVSKSSESITFELKSSEETKKMYPFDFVLKISYVLFENSVKVFWMVENPSDGILPFSIGAHPAFLCPFHGENEKTGYGISFRKVKDIDDFRLNIQFVNKLYYHGITGDTGLSISEKNYIDTESGIYRFSRDFFDKSALIFEDNQANCVGLVDPSGVEYITVIFESPLFGLWSPERKNAPFICIEPWYGRCDSVGFKGDVYQREFTNCLKPNQLFESKYIIAFK